MLKIYLCTAEYYLHNVDQTIYLISDSNYVIRNEADAVTKIKEWSAYTEEAKKAYKYSCRLHQTKKGIKAMYWNWDGGVSAKEWIAPNAKLVANITYEEAACSMKRLMELPAPDVIAYLKQEGLNLSIPS